MSRSERRSNKKLQRLPKDLRCPKCKRVVFPPQWGRSACKKCLRISSPAADAVNLIERMLNDIDREGI